MLIKRGSWSIGRWKACGAIPPGATLLVLPEGEMINYLSRVKGR